MWAAAAREGRVYRHRLERAVYENAGGSCWELLCRQGEVFVLVSNGVWCWGSVCRAIPFEKSSELPSRTCYE